MAHRDMFCRETKPRPNKTKKTKNKKHKNKYCRTTWHTLLPGNETPSQINRSRDERGRGKGIPWTWIIPEAFPDLLGA